MRSRAKARATALRTSADIPLINTSLCFLLLSSFLAVGCAPPLFPALMPYPKEVMPLQNKVDLEEIVNVSVPAGFRENLVPVLESTFLSINKIAKKQITLTYDAEEPGLINISCDKPISDILDLEADESYELDIQQGRIEIRAGECIGALRGLQTLTQLYIKNRGYGYFPGVTITDTSRFSWRGLLLDVARHWQPIENIKRNIDAMAHLKMNVLHLHLSDDQGFRVESKMHPLLHEKGSNQKYYRQEEIKEIIDYAKHRGVYIVPEFDVPAHTTSWFVGYPQYASQPGPYSISKIWGVHTPVFNPTIEPTYTFLGSFFDEMSELFPGEYMHIGGDEVRSKDWDNNTDIVEFMTANNIPDAIELQNYFTQRIDQILAKNNKVMVGWDEISKATLRPNSVLQIWRKGPHLENVINSENKIILSYGYYLDHFRSSEYHYGHDPENFLENYGTPRADQILGGEACMWGEVLSEDNIDARIWPRAAAVAERLWSSKTTSDNYQFTKRLEQINKNLNLLGLQHETHWHQALGFMDGNESRARFSFFSEFLYPKTLAARKVRQDAMQGTELFALVDRIPSEGEATRALKAHIGRYIAKQNGAQGIQKIIKQWEAQYGSLILNIEKHKQTKEILPLAEALNTILNITKEALEQNEIQIPIDLDWFKQSASTLKAAKAPLAGLKIAIVSDVEKLLEHIKQEMTRLPNNQ